MKNYAGNRLGPWLGHLMVSRQETSRPLLTAGEVMQLPPSDELVLTSGTAPIRAKKARYFEDREFRARILKPPRAEKAALRRTPAGEWADVIEPPTAVANIPPRHPRGTAPNSGIRREPELCPNMKKWCDYPAKRLESSSHRGNRSRLLRHDAISKALQRHGAANQARSG